MFVECPAVPAGSADCRTCHERLCRDDGRGRVPATKRFLVTLCWVPTQAGACLYLVSTLHTCRRQHLFTPLVLINSFVAIIQRSQWIFKLGTRRRCPPWNMVVCPSALRWYVDGPSHHFQRHLQVFRHATPLAQCPAIFVLHDVHRGSRTVKSRLDYCNGVLAGITAQPAAVRGTTNLSRRDHVTVITWPDHVTPLLWRLHWLSFIACKGRQKAIDAWGWPCDVACCSRLLVLQWRHFGGDWKQTIVQCSLIDGSH